MLLLANLANKKRCKKSKKMTENLAHLRVLSKSYPIKYQHDRVLMVFKNLCILVLWTKLVSALEGLIENRGHYSTKPGEKLCEGKYSRTC